MGVNWLLALFPTLALTVAVVVARPRQEKGFLQELLGAGYKEILQGLVEQNT